MYLMRLFVGSGDAEQQAVTPKQAPTSHHQILIVADSSAGVTLSDEDFLTRHAGEVKAQVFVNEWVASHVEAREHLKTAQNMCQTCCERLDWTTKMTDRLAGSYKSMESMRSTAMPLHMSVEQEQELRLSREGLLAEIHTCRSRSDISPGSLTSQLQSVQKELDLLKHSHKETEDQSVTLVSSSQTLKADLADRNAFCQSLALGLLESRAVAEEKEAGVRAALREQAARADRAEAAAARAEALIHMLQEELVAEAHKAKEGAERQHLLSIEMASSNTINKDMKVDLSACMLKMQEAESRHAMELANVHAQLRQEQAERAAISQEKDALNQQMRSLRAGTDQTTNEVAAMSAQLHKCQQTSRADSQEHAAVVEALKLHVLTADEEKSVLLLDLQSFHAAAQGYEADMQQAQQRLEEQLDLARDLRRQFKRRANMLQRQIADMQQDDAPLPQASSQESSPALVAVFPETRHRGSDPVKSSGARQSRQPISLAAPATPSGPQHDLSTAAVLTACSQQGARAGQSQAEASRQGQDQPTVSAFARLGSSPQVSTQQPAAGPSSVRPKMQSARKGSSHKPAQAAAQQDGDRHRRGRHSSAAHARLDEWVYIKTDGLGSGVLTKAELVMLRRMGKIWQQVLVHHVSDVRMQGQQLAKYEKQWTDRQELATGGDWRNIDVEAAERKASSLAT